MGCFKTKLSSHFTAEETGFQRTQGASRVTGARHSPEPAVFPPPPVPWSRAAPTPAPVHKDHGMGRAAD